MSSSSPDPRSTPAATFADFATARPVTGAGRAVFGQVMGLVALTLGCLALGAYVGRNLTGGAGGDSRK